MTAAATVVRPLSHPRPALKRRVAAMSAPPSATPTATPQSLWCGQCAHPNSEHDSQGCNHLDADGGIHVLCSCTIGGGAR